MGPSCNSDDDNKYIVGGSCCYNGLWHSMDKVKVNMCSEKRPYRLGHDNFVCDNNSALNIYFLKPGKDKCKDEPWLDAEKKIDLDKHPLDSFVTFTLDSIVKNNEFNICIEGKVISRCGGHKLLIKSIWLNTKTKAAVPVDETKGCKPEPEPEPERRWIRTQYSHGGVLTRQKDFSRNFSAEHPYEYVNDRCVCDDGSTIEVRIVKPKKERANDLPWLKANQKIQLTGQINSTETIP